MKGVQLGFEVETGDAVVLPPGHLVVTGQTQLAGKTTALEGLLSRHDGAAIAFKTKRGERAFEHATPLRPYFRERADWQFVAAVLESTMRERMKFERAWIMRASKGAKTLADVHDNVKRAMEKAKGLNLDIYSQLDAYLDIVVPRLARISWAHKLQLTGGLNVMDLSDPATFPAELQGLVMRSALEYVHQHEEGVITVIPEAWEFMPQSRGSPVKLAAVELMRKGAALGNFVWLDSQDIGGVDKEVLRQCSVWLLGVQRESNEIKRVLDNIPAGTAKPKPADIASLEKGQFYACFGRHVIKTYAQPSWMPEDMAIDVANGKLSLTAAVSRAEHEYLRGDQWTVPERTRMAAHQREPAIIHEIPPPEPEDDDMADQETKDLLRQLLERMPHNPNIAVAPKEGARTEEPDAQGHVFANSEALYNQIRARLLKDQVVLRAIVQLPELEIAIQRHTVQVSTTQLIGMLAKLLKDGFFDGNGKIAAEAWREVKRRWNYGGISARCNEQLDKLTEMGFVTKESDGRFVAVTGVKVKVVDA